MPVSRTKQKNAEIAARSAALPKIPKELMDQLVSGPMTGEEVNAATMAFKKALIERVMGAELGHHLGQHHSDHHASFDCYHQVLAFALQSSVQNPIPV